MKAVLERLLLSQKASTSSSATAHGDSVKAEAAPPAVRVTNLAKRFQRAGAGGSVIPIDEVSFELAHGELVVLLGPSGSGKTTLLRCIGGLERPDSGEIAIGNETVYSSNPPHRTFVPPNRRRLSMVFQSYALWPHMTVRQNVAYPLQAADLGKVERRSRITNMLELMGLGAVADQYPGRISGGQQQRVALARALVARPRVVLFDEPLSNVDAFVRQRLRIELVRLQRELGFSGIYVTHDQEEAMEIGQRIAILDAGKILAFDTPKRIYEHPTSRAVAEFVGTINRWEGTVTSIQAERTVVACEPIGEIAAANSDSSGVRYGTGSQVSVIWRPERAVLRAQPRPDAASVNTWSGIVEHSLFSGPHTRYLVRCGDSSVQVWASDSRWREGDHVSLSIDPADLRVMEGTS